MFKKMSIKMAILIPVLAVLIAGVVGMVLIVGSVASTKTHELTDDYIDASVREYANKFEAISNYGYAKVRSLAPVVKNFKENDPSPRDSVVDMLVDVLESDPSVLAVWTAWEPNAFDGKDSQFVNRNEYHDSTGRFVPYVYRDGNNVYYEPLADYTDPVEGLYY